MEAEKNRRLLSEFAPHTHAAWKGAAEELLKGRSFEKTLVTPTYEGFALEPIYMSETVGDLAHLGEMPGMGSHVRGARVEGYLGAGWLVSQELAAPTPEALNAVALEELAKGQNELNVWLDAPSRAGRAAGAENGATGVCGVSLATLGDLRALMQGIHAEMISQYWQAGAAAPALYALLLAWWRESGTPLEAVRGCLGMDPVGWMAETGALPGATGRVFDDMAAVIESAARTVPALQVVDVQGHPWHKAGASSVQEMAAVLATGVGYLGEMQRRGLAAETVAPRMRLSVSIGGHFFIEIAKLRALRLLWSRVLDAFAVPASARGTHLHARTGLWNKTVFDPYVNMLRTTTEAFAAVVGGCDSLHVGPFDEVIRESDAFSRRVARNTHAILGEECGMQQVIDPAGGSWAVEALTDQMAAQAWKQFQEIEAAGGILATLEAGALQDSVEAVRLERMKNIQRRKDVMVGINTYPNATEKPLPPREIDYDAVLKERLAALQAWKAGRDAAAVEAALEAAKAASGAARIEALAAAAATGATLDELYAALDAGEPELRVKPVRLQRAAAEYEALRLAARALAEAGRPATVHQLNMGPSRGYRARADWTSSFFQAGGFTVLNEDDYPDPAAAAAALTESGARAAVITSDDATYATTVAPLARALKERDPGIRVLVAGAPGENEAAWREAGVDDFVHVRVNAYAFNRELLESMGARL
jgi:methylmalonyl-CoA mutase